MNLKNQNEMIMRDISNNTNGNASKKGLKEFRKNLKVYLNEQLNNYIGSISIMDKIKREYINTLISAILIEHNRNHKNTDIHISGRFKADESFQTKLLHRGFKKDFDKPIEDIAGFKIIIDNTKNILSPSTPLSQERNKNLEILAKFDEYRDEYLSKDKKYFSSRKDYFENLRRLLICIQNVLPEEAINLINSYREKENVVAQKLKYLDINSRKTLNESDLHINSKEFKFDKSKSDFEYLLDDFEARIDDKIQYQILVNQIRTIIKTSKMLKNFDISIKSEKSKKTENGYVAKFIKLDTPAGTIEIQLQTKNQFYEGKTGLPAHMNYKQPDPPEPIPDDLSDISKIQEYRNKIKPKLPEFYTAYIDNTSIEPAVIIRTESEYSSLKELYQVEKGSPIKDDIENYLEAVYKNRRILLEKPDSYIDSIQIDDIKEFLDSDNFQKLVQEKNKEKELEEK